MQLFSIEMYSKAADMTVARSTFLFTASAANSECEQVNSGRRQED